MRNLHPYAALAYFVSLIIISGFSFDPFFLVPAFLGLGLYFGALRGAKKALELTLRLLCLILAVALVNPLFSHNGATVLLFINDNRVTLEAVICGAVTGLALADAVLIFKCFNIIFDSEKLTYVFGRAFPSVGLVISMALAFIPRLRAMYSDISSAQKTLGGGRIKRAVHCFSAVITGSLEGSIITADSMRCRGYGTGRRTFFSRFRFRAADGVFLAVSCFLFAVPAAALALGRAYFSFYPAVHYSEMEISNLAAYTAFGLLSLLPFIIDTLEVVRWKHSISGI